MEKTLDSFKTLVNVSVNLSRHFIVIDHSTQVKYLIIREGKIVKHLRYGFCLIDETNRITENVIIFSFAYDFYKKKII